MNRRNKRIRNYFILFSLLLVFGIVYAVLQANLQINGTAKIVENEWNVHFDNVVVNPDSVSIGTGDTAATIDPTNNCKVDFEVTLSVPGDFYEFTVDVENEGTIDAMIGTLTKTLKVNNVVVQETPNYLNYTVTYEDGTEILENHLLAKNTSETLLVHLEFRRDIDNLPQDSVTISTSVEPVFVQADSGAMPIREDFSLTPGLHFVDFNHEAYLGEALSEEITTYDNFEDAVAYWDNAGYNPDSYGDLPHVCSKVVLENNIITKIYNEFEITEANYEASNAVTVGVYELRAGVDETALPEEQQVVFKKNIATLKLAFGEENCYLYGSIIPSYSCAHNDIETTASVSLNGEVLVGMSGDMPHCYSQQAFESNPPGLLCYP